jgi:hypothetical protein
MPQRLPTPVDPAMFADLEPETFLPEQFFAEPQPRWSGELALLWTVFIDGIEAFRKEVLAGNEGSELYLETLEWLHLRGTDSIFSFDSLCETFGFDPEWLRAALFAWRARQRLRPAKAA